MRLFGREMGLAVAVQPSDGVAHHTIGIPERLLSFLKKPMVLVLAHCSNL